MKPINTGLHCPNCGVKDVWQDDDDAGDYYAGTAMHCLACGAVLSDIQVSDAPDPASYHAKERAEFIHCVRTGEQPPPKSPLPPGPYDPLFASIYDRLSLDQWSDAPARRELSGISKWIPKEGDTWATPLTYGKEPK